MTNGEVINLLSSDDDAPPNPPKRLRLDPPRAKTEPPSEPPAEPARPLSAPNPGPDSHSAQLQPASPTPAPPTITPSKPTRQPPSTPQPATTPAPTTPAAAPAAPPPIDPDDDDIAFISHTCKGKPRDPARPGSTIAKQEPSTPATPATPTTPHIPVQTPTSRQRSSNRRTRPSGDTPHRSQAPSDDDDDGVEITDEHMGPNIMVDAPHPRYMCRVKPFYKKRREIKALFCRFCHCYVCDVPAAGCISWNEHCRAVDKPYWNGLRQAIREQRENRRKDPAQSGTMYARFVTPQLIDMADVPPIEEDSPDDGVSSDSMDNVEWYPPVDHDAIEEASNLLGSIINDAKEFDMSDLLKHLDEPVQRTSALRKQDTSPFDMSKAV